MALDVISSVIGTSRDVLTDVFNRALEPVSKAIDDARATIIDLSTSVANGVDRQIASAQEALAQTEFKLTGEIEANIKQANELVTSLTDDLNQTVTTGIDSANATILGVGAKLGTLTEAALETLRVSLQESADKTVQALLDAPAPIAIALSTALGIDQQKTSEELAVRLTPLAERMENNPEIPEEIKALSRPGALPLIAALAPFFSFAGGLLFSNVLTALLQPVLRKAVYEEEKSVRSNLLTANEAIEARVREYIDSDYLTDTLSKLGYMDNDRRVLEALALKVIGIADTIILYRRSAIDQETLLRMLHANGVRDSDIPLLLQASEQLLDVSTLQELWRRGLVSDEGFSTGVTTLGFDAERAVLLREAGRAVLDGGTLLKSWQRGLLSDSELSNGLSKLGIPVTDHVVVREAARQLVDENKLLALWQRGDLPDDSLELELKALGYNGKDIINLKQAAYALPGISDLILFAVREVFTPEIAEKFGQNQDFPPEFEKQAKRIGVSPQNARWYWAAHWELPTVEQGFEMLHRGQITQEELALLLRAKDVMPFWREKLIKVSYVPLTRVDVRRMHKLGILSREGVKKAYKDIGYDDVNAESLTVFTEKLNAEEDKETKAKERDVTKAEFVQAFVDNLIGEKDLRVALVALGYDEAEANFLAGLEQYKKLAREHRNDIALVKLKVNKGHLDLNGAVDALGKLDLTPKEMTETLTDLQIELERNVAEPTRSELDSFLKKKLINVDTYKEELKRIGYSDKWISAYVRQITGKIEASLSADVEKSAGPRSVKSKKG